MKKRFDARSHGATLAGGRVPLLPCMFGLLLQLVIASEGYADTTSVDLAPETPTEPETTARREADSVDQTEAEKPEPDDAEPKAEAEPAAPQKEKKSSWSFKWDGWDGIEFATQETTSFKNPAFSDDSEYAKALSKFSVERMTFHARIGIRTDVDVASVFSSGEDGDTGLQAELRRFRILTKGDFQLVLPFLYQLELGYVPTEFYVENMYLAMDRIDYIGQLKLGSYSAPMGFENVMSSRWIIFMEESTPTQALTPGVNLGLQMSRSFREDNVTLQIGLFTDGLTSDSGDASSDYGRVIGRATWLLDYDEGDAPDHPVGLMHVGVSVNEVFSSSEQIQYRARPEVHLAPYVVDTGVLKGQRATTVGLEAVNLKDGRLLQGEFFYSMVDLRDDPSAHFFGGYVSSSWILTGENRSYNRQLGTFNGVAPKDGFDWKHWRDTSLELSVRASYTDLADGSIDGGRVLLGTVGLTAYLRDRVRYKCNVVGGQSWVGGASSGFLALEMRISVDLGP